MSSTDVRAEALAALSRVMSHAELLGKCWLALNGPPGGGVDRLRAEERWRSLCAERAEADAERAKAEAAGEDWDGWDGVGWDSGEWPRMVSDLADAFRWFHERIDAARSAVRAVAPIMDAGEPRPPERWTNRAIADLNYLAGIALPAVEGVDGRGIVRTGRPLPAEFERLVDAVRNRRAELLAVEGRGEPPTDGYFRMGELLRRAGLPETRHDAARVALNRAAKAREWRNIRKPNMDRLPTDRAKWIYHEVRARECLRAKGFSVVAPQ